MLKFIHKTALAIMICLATSLSITLQAANIYVDVQANGANNGTTWANAFTSLTNAINAATAGDLIYVSQGT